MNLRTGVIATFCFLQVYSLALCPTGYAASMPSFSRLVGETAWQVTLKDFTVSLEKEGAVFKLRVGDGRYLGFSARREEGGKAESFGPLRSRYLPELAALLKYALVFSEQERAKVVSMNVDWELYPDSIGKWAATWKDSDLRKKWAALDRYKRYAQLTGMISGSVTEDLQGVLNSLGFKVTGASMEKMVHMKAGKLAFYKAVLKPAGIPESLKIPIPMMLQLLLEPLEDQSASQSVDPGLVKDISVDSLFVTAKRDETSLYCTFQRALDEYQITGDSLSADGTVARVRPMSGAEYRPIAARLLNACLKATGGDKRKSVYLRVNLDLYPEVYRDAVKWLTDMTAEARKAPVPRPQLPGLKFYRYAPPETTGFKKAVIPFLESVGFECRYLLVSGASTGRAGDHPEYENLLKPLGIKKQAGLIVPDIVYLVGEKE